MTAWDVTADLAVVGSGVAGLTAALRATELGLRVVTVTKSTIEDGNTRWAQGGVAVVLPDTSDDADSVDAHVADTVAAGAGLCDDRAVQAILTAGPAAVSALRARGAAFDGSARCLERTKEGGHRAFRVIHAGGDATGAEVERVLAEAARGGQLALIERQPVTEVLLDDTGRVAGLALLRDRREPRVLRARAVLLATGGLGQLYAASTNPEVATGHGLALALQAGALAADLEFIQFHPTALYLGAGARGRQPLVTEAIRGAGAVLLDASGAPVMTNMHPLGGLAPRDVVAAAITSRMAATGTDHVLLDATHLGGAELRRRFPTVYAACRAIGVDPGRSPIPVVPAAHYHCGGVVTDTRGRSTVPGLYAAGEVARTGLHGANRLGSNSLLEGLVMGARAAEAVAADLAMSPCPGAPQPFVEVRPVADRDAVQRAMSAHAGIGRDATGLATACGVARDTTQRPILTPRDAEDAGLSLAAAAVLVAATARGETRGCHVRTDYPRSSPRWRRSITVMLDDAGVPVLTEPTLVGGAA